MLLPASGHDAASVRPEAGPSVDVMGLDFARLTEAEVVDQVIDRALAGRGYWTVTANLDHLRQVSRDPDIRKLVGEADLVVADGLPIVWASKVAGDPLPERVAGSSMMWSIAETAAERGARLFFLGGSPGAADAAADVLRERFPSVDIAGTLCPPMGFEKSDEELDAIEVALAAARPDLVLVALGFPKQDILIRRLRRTLPQVSFMGIGISLSFVCGEVQRAPKWMQAAGLEWVHRLLQEPGRLFKRYVVHGLPFAGRLMATACGTRIIARSTRRRERVKEPRPHVDELAGSHAEV